MRACAVASAHALTLLLRKPVTTHKRLSKTRQTSSRYSIAATWCACCALRARGLANALGVPPLRAAAARLHVQLVKLGRFEAALQDFLRASQLEPNNPYAPLNAGICYQACPRAGAQPWSDVLTAPCARGCSAWDRAPMRLRT